MNFGPSFTDHIIQIRPSIKLKGRLKGHQPLLPPPVATNWRWRLTPLVCGLGLVVSIVCIRLWQLQVISGQHYLAASQQNSQALQVIPAPRGIIYDRSGAILARNLPTFRLAVTAVNLPHDPEQLTSVIAQVASLTNLPTDQIKSTITQAQANPLLPATVKANISHSTEIAFLTRQNQLPGFSVEQDQLRSYPLGAAFSHLLGYTGSITANQLHQTQFALYYPGEAVGQAGLEQQYETSLHGQLGQSLTLVNAQGQPQAGQTSQAPIPGHNLVLNINSQLQQKAFQALSSAMNSYHTTGAVGVFTNPQNGQVLALVSVPSFDNNLFAQGISVDDYQGLTNDPFRPLFDRAIAGTYPPGSVVKPLVAAAAIQNHVITKDTIINSPSYITLAGYQYADWTYWLGRAAPGPINVLTAIAQSCDTFFYQVGGGNDSLTGLGVSALKHFMTQAGLGSLTGIDLPGEVKGVVPDPAWKAQHIPDDPSWYTGNTFQLAIGQSYLLTTPLQINAMTAAIANGGTLYRPQVVQKITDDLGATIQTIQPQVIRDHIADADALRVSQEGMRLAVTVGIVYPFRTNPWPVAAKTGTAEFGTPNALGENQTHSWVTGYAPADHPQIAFTVLLESGGSSTNAAQVANDILGWYANNEKNGENTGPK